MAEGIGKERKKEIMKRYYPEASRGYPLEKAKDRFEREIGSN